jgi:hypothetical protein
MGSPEADAGTIPLADSVCGRQLHPEKISEFLVCKAFHDSELFKIHFQPPNYPYIKNPLADFLYIPYKGDSQPEFS